MKSHYTKWPGALLVANTFVLSLLSGGLSDAQEKDMREFVPPQSSGAVKRAVGPDDVAKAQANASSGQERAWRSGVIDSGLAPFPAAMYQFENQWHEIVNGAHLKVYAGSLGKDASQGVVVIQRISLDNDAEPPQEIRAPAGVGSLRITAAQGTLLTLKSSQGAAFTLDAATRSLSAP
jgi:hypothetical protein